MNVAVHYRRQQQRLQSAARAVLGDGLLDRARNTSLALLGLTAAVGLAMVAMALNQSWPLIAGAPIPSIGERHQAVGDATVAEGAKARSDHGVVRRTAVGAQGSIASNPPQGKGAGVTPAPASQPAGSESLVVSRSTPVSSAGSGSPDDATPVPAPVSQQPAVTPAPAAASPSPVSAVSPPAQPPEASVSTPSDPAPVPSAGTPPPDSSEEVDPDDDCPPEDEWDSGHDDSHGWSRGHGRGRW